MQSSTSYELPPGLVCQQCGYDLRGLTGDACPECGRSLAGVRTNEPQIPWVHRRKLGRVRAYWGTVWMVMFRQAPFCDELARPVSFSDAQRFRWMTIGHVLVPLAAAILVVAVVSWRKLLSESELPPGIAFVLAPVAVLLSFLFLLAATGLPGYFFHPRCCSVLQQNRAIGLSYYASGPLALMVIPLAAWVVGSTLPEGRLELLCKILAVVLSLASFAVWWLDLIHLSRRLLPNRRSQAWLVAVFVPALWLVVAVALFVLLPLVLLYIWLAVAGIGSSV